MYDGLFHEFSPVYGKGIITQADVEIAEQRLGFRLPSDHIRLLKYQNGGILRKSVARTELTRLPMAKRAIKR